MATSSTSTFDLQRDVLIRRSFQIAGLLNVAHSPGADDLGHANDILQMELMALQAKGIIVTHVERTTQALTASTAAYTLSTDTMDIAIDPNNIAGTIVPASGAETPVAVMTSAEYVAISNKSTSGTPSMVLVERLATVNLTFWPVPSASGTSFRYRKIRFPRDMDTGARTLDLARRWQKAICYSVAYQLAQAYSIPLDRVGFLKNEAAQAVREAMISDVENGAAQIFPSRYW